VPSVQNQCNSDIYITNYVLHVRLFLLPSVEEGLITICLDTFAAGGESIGALLGFSLLYMVVHPNVQKAVQKELDAVVGKDRRPAVADRARSDSTCKSRTDKSRVALKFSYLRASSVVQLTYVVFRLIYLLVNRNIMPLEYLAHFVRHFRRPSYRMELAA
jgi:Cytochrome P450.